MPKRKVLLTGATGYVASQLVPAFREAYDLTLIDVRAVDGAGNPVDDVIICDLSDQDLSQYSQYFQDVDTVIHLGYKGPMLSSASPVDDFYEEQTNVVMAYNVYRAAYDAGVRRVVVASSNHAADWYEHALIHERKLENLDPYQLPLSDNFYGWAKATYEHMGFLFACGALGRKLEVVQLRIGAPREIDAEKFTDNPRGYKRDLGAYFSPRDLRQLTTKAIETPDIVNEHGIPWLVVYGISDNTRAYWSLTNARTVLGYQPEDDSEVEYADDIRKLLTGDASQARGGRVGA